MESSSSASLVSYPYCIVENNTHLSDDNVENSSELFAASKYLNNATSTIQALKSEDNSKQHPQHSHCEHQQQQQLHTQTHQDAQKDEQQALYIQIHSQNDMHWVLQALQPLEAMGNIKIKWNDSLSLLQQRKSEEVDTHSEAMQSQLQLHFQQQGCKEGEAVTPPTLLSLEEIAPKTLENTKISSMNGNARFPNIYNNSQSMKHDSILSSTASKSGLAKELNRVYRRKSFTVEQKLQMVHRKDELKQPTSKIASDFNARPGTVRKILRNKHALLAHASQMTDNAKNSIKHVCRARALHPVLEDVVARFLSLNQAKFLPRDSQLVAQQACAMILLELKRIPLNSSFYFQKYIQKIENAKFSPTWLKRVLRDDYVLIKKLLVEGSTVNKQPVDSQRQLLISILSQYDADDIYNVDESILFYQQSLKRYSYMKDNLRASEDSKLSKAMLSFMLTTNVTGSDRFKLWIACDANGLREDEEIDKNINWANTEAWISQERFKAYLAEFNEHVKLTKGRPVLLLMDNSSVHHAAHELDLSHVCVAIFSPSLTVHLQPLHGGIIKAVKDQFYCSVGQQYLNAITNGTIFSLKPTKASNILAYVWHSLHNTTIHDGWRHVKILNEKHENALQQSSLQPAYPSAFVSSSVEYDAELQACAEIEFIGEVIERLNNQRIYAVDHELSSYDKADADEL